MPSFFRSTDPAPVPPDETARSAIADYLALSRSPLRLTEPEWFDLVEREEWERLRAAVGIER